MRQCEDKLIISSRGRIELFNKCDIFYIQSEQRKIHIHVLSEIHSFNRTLNEVEASMDDRSFLRIHQSFLINTSFVSRIDGDMVYMTTGEHFPVSRRYLTSVHERFQAV